MKGLGAGCFSYLRKHLACRVLVSPALHGIQTSANLCKAIKKTFIRSHRKWGGGTSVFVKYVGVGCMYLKWWIGRVLRWKRSGYLAQWCLWIGCHQGGGRNTSLQQCLGSWRREDWAVVSSGKRFLDVCVWDNVALTNVAKHFWGLLPG